jgi:NAD(P)-dependent dehydrogenase (short-subunit alcohol dehydrogenase family)
MPVRDFSGRRCLITGAAGGIGRATALAAAREGAVLYLTDLDEAGLHRVAGEIRDSGGTVAYLSGVDLTDHQAVEAMAEEIHRDQPGLDVVMNIAGIAIWGWVEELQHSHWQRLVEVNLMGPIHVIECFIPPMIFAGRGGHLVNVSSAAGLFGLPLHVAYSATKFGLRGISEVLRFDLRRHDIGVSLVCPGRVDTPLVPTVEIAGIDRADPRATRLTNQFARRMVTPDRAAEAILEGVRKNRYMVYTSRDIQLAHFVQRTLPPAYELAMRVINARFSALAQQSHAGAPAVLPRSRAG